MAVVQGSSLPVAAASAGQCSAATASGVRCPGNHRHAAARCHSVIDTRSATPAALAAERKTAAGVDIPFKR